MNSNNLWVSRLLYIAAILASVSLAVKMAGANPNFSPNSQEAVLLVNISWGFGLSVIMVYVLSTFTLKRALPAIALLGCIMMLVLGGFLYWVG